VEIESIRWHPDPVRRLADLTVAARRVTEAREGDIVAGVRIVEIRPGSVELQVGHVSRRVELTP
jgi:hypothetical protein